MSVSRKVVAGMAILKGTAERAFSVVKRSVDKFNELGEELVDGRSMEPPLGYVPSESLAEQIARAVRSYALAKEVSDAGGETLEEADDFDVGDDFDPSSPYEAYFEPITERELERLIQAGFSFPSEPATNPPQAVNGPGSPNPPSVPPAPVAAV
nr:MAG TPA: hypothetical protein [Microviridae sp.]